MRFLLACCLLWFAVAPAARAAVIDHLEPGNWWVGMRHDRVELMVHGAGIGRTTPRIDRAGVAVVDVQRTDNPNYLFVTVHVAVDAAPGAVPIAFEADGRTVATAPGPT